MRPHQSGPVSNQSPAINTLECAKEYLFDPASDIIIFNITGNDHQHQSLPSPSLHLQEVVVRLDDPDVVSPVVPSLGPHHSLMNRIELLGSPLPDLHPLLRVLGGLHDSEEVVHVGLLRPHHSHVRA